MPASGKIIVTLAPAVVSDAASSEPMKPAADDDHVAAAIGDRAERPVVVEGAVVDDLVVGAAEPSRRAAGREEELLVAVLRSLVVGRAARVEIERDDPAPEDELGAGLLRVLPDLRLVAAGPEALRERRPLVRRIGLGADEHDRAVCVMLPDAS